MKILKYSFYRIYQLFINTRNADVAEYFAIILLSVLVGLNTFALFSIVYIITGKSVDISHAPKFFSGLLFFGLLITFYLLLVRGEKYKKIIKEYEHESSRKRKKGNALTICYILISIGLLMLCMFLMIQKNRGLI
jgi:hypothetical protein